MPEPGVPLRHVLAAVAVSASLLSACGAGGAASSTSAAASSTSVPATTTAQSAPPTAQGSGAATPGSTAAASTATGGGGASSTAGTPSGATGSASAGAGAAGGAVGSCRALAGSLTREQKVGQLFMVGSSRRVGDDLAQLVRQRHVGSVLYLGDGSPRSAATTAAVSRTVQAAAMSRTGQAAATNGIGVLVATDQEGGAVQRLAGAGFSRIPSATAQARLGDARLQSAWTGWAGQLRAAGVNYDLAPVADVVSAADDAHNAAIGALDRNYGTTAAQVGGRTVAVVKGMRTARVASSLKHYPGLGRATVNTDYGVATDDRTTLADTASFLPAMRAGASSVMISSTIYSRIDPGVPGVFSSRIITGGLRGRQQWRKVVISDDLGAAAAVKGVPVKDRGVRFLAAGGDLVVDADPQSLDAMLQGVLDRAAADPRFARALDDHVTRVLVLKAEVGLTRCTG